MTNTDNKATCIPLYKQKAGYGNSPRSGAESGETDTFPVAEPSPPDYAGMEREEVFSDLFTRACNRLAEVIPKCDDPVKLLKCIEQFSPHKEKEQAPCDDPIEDTLRRIRRFEETYGRYPDGREDEAAAFGEVSVGKPYPVDMPPET